METVLVNDLVPLRTADGSFTLRSEVLDEQYHSVHGAVQESMHVFIRAGLHHVKKTEIDLLEVGLGTGLNALLTWIEAQRLGIIVNYHALEPHPLSIDLLRAVGHPTHLGAPERVEDYLRMMSAADGRSIELVGRFCFRSSRINVQSLNVIDTYDLIYYDAFSPKKQPEMWTEEVFARLHNALRPGGALVTYCAKGAVRRLMGRAGFLVARLQGPPGKTHMVRAVRP